MPQAPDRSTPSGAFQAENPWAHRAAMLLSMVDPSESTIREAQANATLALAFEQRQTRFDVERALHDHGERTGA